MHQHKVREKLYSTLKDTRHRIVIGKVITICFHIRSQLGHSAPQMDMVDDTCRMAVINYQGFITTVNVNEH